jgi:O-antigen/teichoic acid export membrane protein
MKYFNKEFYRISFKGFYSVADQGIVSLTNFVTGWSVAYFCSKSEYGLYVLAFSLILFCDGFRNSLVSSPLVVFLPRKNRENSPNYIGSATIMQSILSSFSSILFVFGAVIIFCLGDFELASTIITGIITMIGFTLREHLRRIFYAQLRIERALIMDVVYAVIQGAGLAGLYHFDVLSVYNVLLSAALAHIASVEFGLFLLRNEFSMKNMEFRKEISNHWRIGKWVIASPIFFFFSGQFFPWILKITDGTESAAILGVCMFPILFLRPLITGISNTIAPRLSHKYAKEGYPAMHRLVIKYQIIMFAIAVIFIPLLIFLSSTILDVLFGGKYTPYSHIFSVLTFPLLFTPMAMPLTESFLVMEKTHYQLAVTIIGVATSLTIGIFLVYYYGLLGAALAINLVAFISFAAALMCYRKIKHNVAKRSLNYGVDSL